MNHTLENNLDVYELVVGLEIHAQLNTQSKLFSSDAAGVSDQPNSHISTVTMGLPGVLPVLNKAVIEKAVRMGLALNCQINRFNAFDRKNYFYADLPKGYQITQDAFPICTKGHVDVDTERGIKRIRINRIHLEEDAGKSLHDQSPSTSFIDLNRTGVPLIEIVTEPDIRSSEEAAQLFSEIRKLVRHFDVGDGNMEEGNLRCDANISIRKRGETSFGTRCEIKNLNSIKYLKTAIEYEFFRQVKILNGGGVIVQSTLNFDASTGLTRPLRTKEEANDYRYFPDPDIPPIIIGDDWLQDIKANMAQHPAEIEKEWVTAYGITKEDAQLLISEPETYQYFTQTVGQTSSPKILTNLMVGPVRALLNESKIEIQEWKVKPAQLAVIADMLGQRKLTQSAVFQELIPQIKNRNDHPQEIAERLNLLISTDETALDELIHLVLQKYPAQITAYKKGKKGLLGLFIGEVMKESGGKFDPKTVNTKLIKIIENEKT